jgi:hypothetical protein
MKLYCALANAGMNVMSNGILTSCCAISDSYVLDKNKNGSLIERLNQNNMVRVRTQLKNGVWPSECSSCKLSEEISNSSLRTTFNDYLKHRNIVENTNTILKFSDVQTLHLSVGNKCNSKCLTCNPGSSSLWKDEWQSIWNVPVANTSDSPLENPRLVNELVGGFTDVKKITFLGGEPTINDSHVDYLRKLIINGRSREIDLGYVTNLTGIDDTLLEIWSNFRKISLNVSIDAYGEKNDYIRYPIKWSKIENNLHKFLELTSKDKISLTLSLTPSAFNCIHLDEMFMFWDQLLTQYDLPKYHNVALNKIAFPLYTSMRITSTEYRQTGISKLEKLKDTIAPEFFASIDYAIAMLKEPVLDNKTIQQGREFIEKSDNYRHKYLRDYIPELYNELWKEQ